MRTPQNTAGNTANNTDVAGCDLPQEQLAPTD
jgi:hypothetical protein